MPQIKNNFTLKSKSPNFDRDSFVSRKDMKEMPTAWMDEGHISYCQEDGNHYVFSVLNKFDTNTGYFRLFKDNEELTEIQRDISDLYNRLNNISVGGGGNIPDDLLDIINDLVAKVNELYTKEYPVTCNLNSNKSIVEYIYNGGEDKRTVELSISIKYKGSDYSREDIEELTITGPSDCKIGDYDKTSTRVSVILPLSTNGHYTFTLTIKTKDGQTKTASCNMYQKARSYVRYSAEEAASEKLFRAEEGYSTLIKSELVTSLNNYSGNFHFTQADGIIPVNSYLWIMVPEGVSLPSMVYGNGFEAQLYKENDKVKEFTVTNNGCNYTCIRSYTYTREESSDMKITFKKS